MTSDADSLTDNRSLHPAAVAVLDCLAGRRLRRLNRGETNGDWHPDFNLVSRELIELTHHERGSTLG